MEIVSKARTAFHSAAAKAERVFTDIKNSDFYTDHHHHHHHRGESDNLSSKSEKTESAIDAAESKNYHEGKNESGNRGESGKTKQDWQDRLKNLRFGKKGAQEEERADNDTMSFMIFDENLYIDVTRSKGSEGGSFTEVSKVSNVDIIPSSAVLKQLAVGVETTKNLKSMKDLLSSSRDSSPVREKAGLGLSAVKSLVLREKDDCEGDEKVTSFINSLLHAEGLFPRRQTDSRLESSKGFSTLPKDIHGAPPESFVVELAEAIGSLKTLRKMASFWNRVVTELRRLWIEEQYIPGIPPDEVPDLNSCLLYQHLQVINCCISRKRRHSIASSSLESILRHASSNVEESADDGAIPSSPVIYARTSSGKLVPRLGADKQSDLRLLETGEPIYTPVMQEGPLLTEDLIKETEEFVLRTGSVGAGCSQLLSDMQSFKAANPGCILEDFVRWHSPPDWVEAETDEAQGFTEGDCSSGKGQLSMRMQKEGNLWQELWETSKPVPAVNQSPLYDEDLAVEGILNFLEDIPPSQLFEQLFVSLLGGGFVIAEATICTDFNLCKLFNECKDYIVAACQGKIWVEKLDDICQVYETAEMMLLNPDEVITITKQPEEFCIAEQKGKFKRLKFIFGGKDKLLRRTPPNLEDNPTRQSFSSLFSKKPPKPGNGSPAEKPVSSVESDWTIV